MNSNTKTAFYFSLTLLFTLLSLAGINDDLPGIVSRLFLILTAAFYFFRAIKSFLNIINVLEMDKK